MGGIGAIFLCTFGWIISFVKLVADVIVHRLLAASLGIYKLPPIFQDRPQLTSIADSKNAKNKLCINDTFFLFRCQTTLDNYAFSFYLNTNKKILSNL